MRQTLWLSTLLLTALTVGTAQQPPAAVTDAPQLGVRADARLGTVLTGDGARTLYTFAKDDAGVSTCEDKCAENWPPLLSSRLPSLPEGLGGTLSLITRKDGARQVAYNGAPLYYWKRDQSAGDALGQGLGNVWFAANVAPTVRVVQDPKLGEVLAGPQGLTLYTFKKDTPDMSACEDKCAEHWPPLLVSRAPRDLPALPGTFGVLTRKDGSLQVTYNGAPLYSWQRDAKPGDTLGQGLGDAWFVARP